MCIRDSKNIAESLEGIDLFWASGGNAFVLNLAMSLSGFDKCIKEKLLKKKVVYGGYSAASVVAGQTLKGIDLVDKTNDFPIDYPETNLVWDGLGLVDYSIAPHFNSNHSESNSIDQLVSYLKSNNLPFKCLRDGEVIVVGGEKL